MKPEIITAIIAAVVAVISAIISVYGQTRIAQLADQLAKKREVESREAQTIALMSKYRDPLLRSVIDLQSRLFNLHQRDFLYDFYHQRSQAERDYAIKNTLYVIAEYFGWVEVLRREIQFLDLGAIEMNRRLSALIASITRAFGTDGWERTLQLYNGEQRAIGEIMLIPRSIKDSIRYECIGYATFVKKLSHPDFAYWFTKLKDDIEIMASEPELNLKRLVVIHGRLIDLIDFLDPDCVRIQSEKRTRIQQK